MGANIYRNKKPALVFLVPGFLFMAVYLYYPFFKNILNSFMEIKQLGSSGTGFNTPWYHNYREMLHDEYVWVFIKNTLLMMAATLAGQVGIAIVLALMVDNIGRGKQFFKTVFFFPIVISATALGLLFNLLFLYDKGMINQVLEALGRKELIDWKAEGIALPTMMLPVMWQYVGFYFVILVTGLNNISDELYEAAKIDGASTMQRTHGRSGRRNMPSRRRRSGARCAGPPTHGAPRTAARSSPRDCRAGLRGACWERDNRRWYRSDSRIRASPSTRVRRSYPSRTRRSPTTRNCPTRPQHPPRSGSATPRRASGSAPACGRP